VIIFSTSSHAPTYATKSLESLQLNMLDVGKILDKVTDTLNCSFLFKMDKAVEVVDLDSSEEMSDVEDDEAFSQGGWSDDDGMVVEDGELSADDDLSDDDKKRLLKELHDDLRQAKKAGFKVGLLGDHRKGDFYLSLSIRIVKLGLSDEAISAWKLDRKKYFIVLIHYLYYYHKLESLMNEHGGRNVQRGVDIMVGMASRYKPTVSQAIDAFIPTNTLNEGQFENRAAAQGEPSKNKGTGSVSDNGDFEGIFLSGPLNELLNSRLLQLLKYRLKFGFGWDGAELFYSGKTLRSKELSDTKKSRSPRERRQ
jgi:ubiquitin-conjugating enzyme E2 Q